MAKIRTVEKLQAQLTGAEAASRKHKTENETLRREKMALEVEVRTLKGEIATLTTSGAVS